MRHVVIAGVLLVLSGGIASAQTTQPAGPAAAHSAAAQLPPPPCEGQWDKVCPDVKPGAGRKLICMNNRLPKLTPACQVFIKKLFAYETDVAAKHHMTMSQYMEWGQNFMANAQAKGAVVQMNSGTPAPAPKASGQSSTPQPTPKQN